ncbi:MAG: hypothetical protein O2917_10540 [Acidobacteria bacterium]|nr:hypothetical protein [Acidobacteriota bacterium]
MKQLIPGTISPDFRFGVLHLGELRGASGFPGWLQAQAQIVAPDGDVIPTIHALLLEVFAHRPAGWRLALERGADGLEDGV